MTAEEMIYRLLYRALIEIRMEAHRAENNTIYGLADLMHNLPLQLLQVARGEQAHEQALADLRARPEPGRCGLVQSRATGGRGARNRALREAERAAARELVIRHTLKNDWDQQ